MVITMGAAISVATNPTMALDIAVKPREAPAREIGIALATAAPPVAATRVKFLKIFFVPSQICLPNIETTARAAKIALEMGSGSAMPRVVKTEVIPAASPVFVTVPAAALGTSVANLVRTF